MKLVIAGSTGYVGTEVVRQAISHPAVTSIVALARRETPVPDNADPDADTTKLKSVVCEDFMNYGETVKEELANADACIWLIAITPSKARAMQWDQVREINHDYTVAALETFSQLPRDDGKKPLRFLYTSGHAAERDQTKTFWLMNDMRLMRGETESLVLEHAQNSKGKMEACIAKPGLIWSSEALVARAGRAILASVVGLPNVRVEKIAAAMLHQSINGFEKETLRTDDLARIGQTALANKQQGEQAS